MIGLGNWLAIIILDSHDYTHIYHSILCKIAEMSHNYSEITCTTNVTCFVNVAVHHVSFITTFSTKIGQHQH